MENVFLAWHCGNAPPCLRAADAELILRARQRPLDAPVPEGDEGAGVWETRLKTGPVTITRLVEYDGVYKMLITAGEIIDDPAPERGSGSWVRVANLEKLYATLFEEGFIHHASMIHGEWSEALAMFCKFAGIETVIV
jgi:L-fucose isomerase-like protein